LYEAAQNFEVFSNIQNKKFKNKKPVAVDVLFKAYQKVPLSASTFKLLAQIVFMSNCGAF
jgi:hypothetical protein